MEHSVPLNLLRPFCRLLFSAPLFLSLILIVSVQAQPVVVKQLDPSTSHKFASVNGVLYFTSADSLFTSDGTAAGTRFIKKIGENFFSISDIATVGSRVYFVTQSDGGLQSLWMSEGTAARTVKIGSQYGIRPLIAYQNELYLAVMHEAYGWELWKVSGNTMGLVKDIFPGTDSGLFGIPGNIAISDGILYFGASTNYNTGDLWKTDGTEAGTVMAADMPFEDFFFSLTDVNGTLFFERDSLVEWDWTVIDYLYKTEGTTESTVLVEEFTPDSYAQLYHFNTMNNKLYFIRREVVPDDYLWVSDGTAAGTEQIKHVERDGDIIEMDVLKKNLVFYSHSQSFPGSLQRSDGTTAGTVPFYRLNFHFTLSSSGDPIHLTETEDYAFFVDHNVPSNEYPDPENEYQIFQSDLTSEGTKSLKELFNTPGLEGSSNIVAAGGNKIFFTSSSSTHGDRLWFYNADQTCAGAGGILREVWNNAPGALVSQIPVNKIPSVQQVVNTFAGPVNAGDRYGARYRGYLCVPQTGNYRFFIASNDQSELWLSTDASTDNKRRIAYAPTASNPGQYNKFPSQQSALIHLQQGNLYYIEALHKEGVNSDHLSVGLQYPDGTLERPILGARLIPASTNLPPAVTLTAPTPGQEYTEYADIQLTANATDADGSIQRVEFYVASAQWGENELQEDWTAPYQSTWHGIGQGTYSIRARAIDNEGASTWSASVTIKVNPACVASGNILREVWKGIQGAQVSYIPVNTAPHETGYMTIFEAPSNIGDHYGTRMRGYVCPPASGNYTFYIASNDHSELWISPDGNPANKVKIAQVIGGTAPREWTKYSSQRSAPIFLSITQKVYIEALHKEGVGNDNIAVGWILPNGVAERPIPGSRLSPFQPAGGRMETEVFTAEPEVSDAVTLTPNPVKEGPVTLSLKGYEHSESSHVKVDIITTMGQTINAKPISCNGNCSEIRLEASNLSPGVYVIRGTVNNRPFSTRLLVQK